MTSTYQPGQAVSINPDYEVNEKGEKAFSATVKVTSSRYAHTQYGDYPSRIQVVWTMETVNGRSFSQSYYTGYYTEGLDGAAPTATISADGKELVANTTDFSGIKQNSDARFLIDRAIASGFKFPKTSDISVFEGKVFLVADHQNSRTAVAKVKPYPKEFIEKPWQQILDERAARSNVSPYSQNASSSAPAAAPQANNAPVAVAKDVLAIASDALMEILQGSDTKSVTRTGLNKALTALIENKTTKTFTAWQTVSNTKKQAVALALWDINQLSSVVGTNPQFKLEGDTVLFTG